MGSSDLAMWLRQAFDPWLPDLVAAATDVGPTAVQEAWGRIGTTGGQRVLLVARTSRARPCRRGHWPALWDHRLPEAGEPGVHAGARMLRPERPIGRQKQAMFRSEYRRRLGRDQTARDQVDLQKARQTAQAGAGAGVVDVSLYATVSAPDEQSLHAVTTDLEARAGVPITPASRLWGAGGGLRRNPGCGIPSVESVVSSGRSPPVRPPRAALPLRRGRRGAGGQLCRVGSHLYWGEAVSVDPFAWLTAGLTTNTGMFHLGQPGTGKSAFAKRQIVGWSPRCPAGGARGRPGEYALLVARLGGQVIRVGRGLDRLNPWTPRATPPGWTRGGGDSTSSWHCMCHGAAGSTLSNGEQVLLSAALDEVVRRGGQVLVPQILHTPQEPSAELFTAAQVRTPRGL